MSSFGSRLREERERLGISVAELAALARVSQTVQVAFEGDAAPLDARHLSDLATLEIDVRYVVTGNRQQLPGRDGERHYRDNEIRLLAHYLQTTETGKRLIAAVARLAAARTTSLPVP